MHSHSDLESPASVGGRRQAAGQARHSFHVTGGFPSGYGDQLLRDHPFVGVLLVSAAPHQLSLSLCCQNSETREHSSGLQWPVQWPANTCLVK